MNSFPNLLSIQEEHSWQYLLSHTIDDPQELLKHLDLPSSLLEGAKQGNALFSLKVPLPFVEKMEKGNPDDPLLRQVLPLAVENSEVEGFITDPLAEMAANHSDGLIHKYKGRVLLILSGACAVNCRYCFRRHFPYQENRLGSEQWQKILDYLNADSSINEVIFSGGDPLATSDARLQKMISDLEQIPHLQRLRIHTRLPVVIPQRITDEFVSLLNNCRFDTVMVLHANHAKELDSSIQDAVSRLKAAHVTILNQAVLLKGINDNVSSLKALSESLFSHGILPYYLFTLDPVKGAAHFDIPDQMAIQLHSELQSQLPGYLLPKLAREIPGKPSKTLLF
ncbi:EF-P beta-lysylation protein EpmB [Neptuniibacter sp.]|uniref:EF-P beta-lysylation protein EpmB n=1 Tax=Neptuniibacter sp. TaxID=1962643 RepID=UPI0026396E74|nr:EF-P beta-lysylation protein EpmB [Neptuniibacter sp.]MCP4595629.1 EF-P beta-lysylation protein EpmB [Neptuniibacter sp.]